MKIAIAGGAGETGNCIINALLQSNIPELVQPPPFALFHLLYLSFSLTFVSSRLLPP